MAALGATLAVLVPGVAAAHNAGRVDLLVTNLKFAPAAGGVSVTADLIDRDSGSPAVGFAIVVNAREAGGATAGPVTMLDPRGTGRYEGVLALPPGAWTVTGRAEQGMSVIPALGSSRAAKVKLDDSGAVITQGPEYGRSSDKGTWMALMATGVVMAIGAFLALTRRSREDATTTSPVGQRVAE